MAQIFSVFKSSNHLKLFLCFLFLSSCVSVRDVTYNSKYHLGYKPGELYLIKKKVYLVKYDNYTLSPLGFAGNPDFRRYYHNKESWPNILGIIDVGTELKITKIIQENTFESNYLWVFAKIMNGKYRGKEVLVNFISLSIKNLPYDFPNTDKYDPKYLEPVGKWNGVTH